jgi:SAM-dependent methyltransferase
VIGGPPLKLKKRIRSFLRDLRFGKSLYGRVATRFAHMGAHDTANTDYDALQAQFEGVIQPGDVLVDVGCGKGRVLNFWLSQYPEHKIVGLELDPVIAQAARRRLSKFSNVTVLDGDAVRLLPADGDVFYLFNPFNRSVFETFIEAFEDLPPSPTGRARRLVYYSCAYLDLFKGRPGWSIRRLAMPEADMHDAALLEFSRFLPS